MISIITIVKNDRGIENTLEKLVTIPKPDTSEIIVVDASGGKLDDIKNRYPSVNWINYFSPTGKKITIPEQRNTGVKTAKGNIIVFIDSSCIPVDNWLFELFNSYTRHSDAIICGAIIPTSNKALNNIWHASDKSEIRHESPTGNILLDKKVFTKIGYFDESLSYGEDIDFTWRAVKAGFTIRFNNKAIVSHDWGNFMSEIQRSYKYGKARAMLYKKHRYKWKSILYKDRVSLIYSLYVLFFPLVIIFPLYPLILLIPIIKNIGRYKFQMMIKLIILNIINGVGVIKGLLFNF